MLFYTKFEAIYAETVCNIQWQVVENINPSYFNIFYQ